MASSEALLSGLASGDTALAAELPRSEVSMKREQDSMDDFEHLDREGKKVEAGESPVHNSHSATTFTQSFLDMERSEEFSDPPRAPSVTEKMDHLADKFTDSESDVDPSGESPRHVPEPQTARQPTPEPLLSVDPTPALVPTAAAPAPSPSLPKPASETKLEKKIDSITDDKIEDNILSFNPVKKVEDDVKVASIVPDPAAPSPPVPAPSPPKVEPAPSKELPAAPATPTTRPDPRPETPQAPTAHIIEAEVIFCQMGLDAWFDPQRLHPEVESLIYWRCAARSGAALGAGLVLLVALACCSVVSVLAYASLLALSAAVAFRIYKNILQAVQKTNEGHPFKLMLERDISVGVEQAQSLAAAATAHLNAALHELRRLFFVEDLVDSLKFGVLLWCLTYVGACFNGMTLIILGWIALFTLPKAYEMNKAQVDANLELARGKINEIVTKVRAAVPIGRKSESEKDK